MSHDSRERLLRDAAERGIRYLQDLDKRTVYPEPDDLQRLEKALASPLPDAPTNSSEVLSFLDDLGSPATVSSAGGRYFGFVTGGALPATVAANWLATAWDQNCFVFAGSPAVALFEETALGWLKDVLELPVSAEGTLVTGATMANFSCLASARGEVLRRAGWDVESRGLSGAPEIKLIVGEEVHASVLKVLGMLGLGRDTVQRVAVDEQGRMRTDALPRFSGPAIVCLQAGNVNSGAFDPAEQIIPLAHEQGAWVHVDGAFGLWASASPALKAQVRDFKAADSWATDAHKWLNVPYDCGVAFVRSPEALHRAMSISGSYLLRGKSRDAIDVTPDSSRRARAVEVWAALKSLGRTGLAELVERNCRQAKWLAEHLAAAGVEVLNEVNLNQVVVCFGNDERSRRVISTLQGSGVCWCGSTTWQGRHAMRISLSSWATTDADVEKTLAAILAARESEYTNSDAEKTERGP
ncbi:MAG: aminotransferase class V-fold PLP-dependent enzyme [Gammaproteobacteria bacterium]|nr:aminotransferase class V-fold PLP-dependent enzyme [Gammaproteobacteria bacterium]